MEEKRQGLSDAVLIEIVHGGDSIEELLVPFVRIGEIQNG